MSGGRATFEAVIAAMLESICETCQQRVPRVPVARRCDELLREAETEVGSVWEQLSSMIVVEKMETAFTGD